MNDLLVTIARSRDCNGKRAKKKPQQPLAFLWRPTEAQKRRKYVWLFVPDSYRDEEQGAKCCPKNAT